jgi:hypothetical protein
MWMPDGEDDNDNVRMLAHSYVPWQYYDEAFSPQKALMKGTLFPELFGVYKIPK